MFLSCSLLHDWVKLFAEIFPKNSYFDDSGISLPASPSKTNLKLNNIPVTPKMVKEEDNCPSFLKGVWS